MTMDYKTTVFLPKTDFPMKAGLPDLEPRLLARWKEIGLFDKLRRQSAGREKFVLHDGPPYANGHLHIGHALNKILKDVINRCQQMLGKDAHYVPGWDCHGLPIEWKIEEKYREAGLDKDAVDPIEFRKECREFAAHWIEVQKAEFQRLGLEGDWDRPYTTMAFAAEAQIVRELGKFVMNGGLYKGAKPVMWSVVEKTALAEAEVEYHDHSSVTIWVRFPVIEASRPELEGASVVIWTTTPWTMPGNRAVAFGPSMTYHVYRIDAVAEGSLAVPGERLVLSEDLASQVMTDAKVTAFSVVASLPGSALAGTVLSHPWKTHPEAAGGYAFPVPLLPGDFVTNDTGTGFVHIAPGHGEDDWRLGQAHGIAVPDIVMPDGTYYPSVPLFAGQSVLAAGKKGEYYSPVAKPVIEAMKAVGALLHHGKVKHSYPHSWRSKAPLIFRTTPQWFISMQTNDLRAKALAAIDETRWVPAQGRNRIYSMVENRPDWCVSRQRAWGVPITVFVHKTTGEVMRDQAVIDRIAAAVEAEGADAWFTSPPERFLGNDYKSEDWEQVGDILDVWFDSGCTHAFVLENGGWGLPWPASLYLEGSDQHRGWFHSSLLESCGTRGRAPYDAVLTHGFVLDEEGRKMSKSLGNVVSPQEVVAQFGADILRLWVIGSDYSEDLRIGPEIIKTQVDIYRRLRNTLRYLLGALDGFSESERLDPARMPPLERWVLHRLSEMDGLVRQACKDFQFHNLFAELHNFCAVDLSAFYFDIRKDSLYCDHSADLRRRATRTVMDLLFTCLTRWLAPFLCFTAEEAYLARNPGSPGSIHLEPFFDVPESWRDDALARRWAKIRDLRRVVTGALEIERGAKRIGSSLQAAPQVVLAPDYEIDLDGLDLAEIAITSKIVLERGDIPSSAFALPDVPGIGVVFRTAEGEKCQRCWKVLPDVGTHAGHEGLCGRCADVVAKGGRG
ncbi:isoleucine--tRNA ligase [Telmatospirillum siberiense]|uniref:Isoleucine--tRNA ligase n=1 Tax=Telmatospirillum siberiense TaxID=382514 RepID=A0A2N3PNQ2_9PROT|nr:isoleucine--tRNA ligase [Telmatospirillum siberiense]PKU22039.1 isoleucine--tRNA ligase [Telmatospirillum siberiense]